MEATTWEAELLTQTTRPQQQQNGHTKAINTSAVEQTCDGSL